MSPSSLRSRALAVVALFGAAALTGCPQPIDAEPCADGGTHLNPPGGGGGGGTDGGGGGGGGTDGGGGGGKDGGGGGGDGGTNAGMDAGVDAGAVSRADAGPFSWAIIPGSAASETVHSVHGTSATNVYVATSKGIIRRSTGGPFSDVYLAATSSAPVLYAVTVTPNGNVFAGGQSTLVACTNGVCQQQSDFVKTGTDSLAPMYGTIRAMCSRGNETVYGVGYNGTRGRIWQYDFGAGAWVVRVPDTGANDSSGCFISASGDLFIGSPIGKIVRMTPAYLSFVEPVNAVTGFDPTYFDAEDIVSVNGRFFAVGSERRIVERDNATRTWNVIFNPPSSFYDSFAVVSGGAADELYAAGASANDNTLTRWDGLKWSLIPNSDPRHIPYFMSVYDMWMPDADTLFLAGNKGPDGVVVLGVR